MNISNLFKFIIIFFSVISCKENIDYPKYVELETANKEYSLFIRNGTFSFLKTEFVSYDQIITSEFLGGKYKISNNELILTSKSEKKYIFKIGNDFELSPLRIDSIKNLNTLFPIKILHNNMMPKEIGSRDSLGRKNALWLYFDEKGKTTNQQLFKNGQLIKDNYKSNIVVK